MTSPTVLVIEDNPITIKMVRFALEKKGYTVLHAPDGQTALRLMAEGQPSLVLQDLILPDIDGFDLVAKLRQVPRGCEIPILAFSGFLSRIDEARLAEVGFDDLVTKPIEPSRLVRLIEAYLPVQRGPIAPFGQGLRLLLVDDDAVQRKLAFFRLAGLGFEVTAAADGVEALERAHGTVPHLIVSDIMMPRLDGYGLCSAIRREPSMAQTPVILTTSTYIEAADRTLAERVGATRYVVRTPDLGELIEAVRASLAEPRPPASAAVVSPDVEREHADRILSQLEKQVARNVGMTLRNAQLAAELSVLSGISDALSRHRNIDAALDDVLSACFDASGISVGALYLTSGEGSLRVRRFGAYPGWNGDELETFFGNPELLRAIVASGVPTPIPSSAIPAHQSQVILERSGARSALVIPLVKQDERLGALLMVSRSTQLNQDDRIDFARSVAGQIAVALILARTFAEKERSEAEARRQATLLRSIIDSIGDGIIVADEHGKVNLWNRAAAARESVDIYAEERRAERNGLFRPDQVTLFGNDELPLARAVRGDSVDHEEMFVRPPGAGEGRWFSVSARPVRDEQGIAHGGVVVFRDVTQEKATHEQLILSDRMASVGTLAAGVAHEINNPLAAMSANLDLALRDVATLAREVGPRGVIDDLKEELDDTRTAANRVVHIVRDLKIFSRAEEDKRGPVDVERVLDSTVRMAWNEIRHRANLVKDYRGVPPIIANESRLGQVFLNLIVNAAQAINEGWVEENEIRVCTRVDGSGRVVIDIADTGHGIAPDVMRRLFTPFFTTKPVGVGTGLGLSICHRIVSGLGGEITVESEHRRGTTFHVALPAAPPLVIAQEELPPPTSSAPGRRGRILVIDDEDALLAAIRRILGGEHDVTLLTSAMAALKILRAGERFDVILCDLMMPEMTGMDFFGEVSKHAPEQATRIVFVTGGAFTPRVRAFLEEAPNLHITKPFELEQLRSIVNECVRSAH